MVLNLKDSLWDNLGQSNLIGNLSSGSVSTDTTINNFGYFTWGIERLANLAACNYIPTLVNCEIDLICNGGFEQGIADSYLPNFPGGYSFIDEPSPNVSATINWEDYLPNSASSCDLFIRGNTVGYGVPLNFFSDCRGGSLDTWSGHPNDRYAGLVLFEGLMTNLVSPLVAGTTYTISLMGVVTDCPYTAVPTTAPYTAPIEVYAIPNVPHDFADEILLTTFNISGINSPGPWNLYSTTFTLPIPSPSSNISYENLVFRNSNGSTLGQNVYVFVDDIKLTTSAFATFTNSTGCIDEPTFFSCNFSDPSISVTYAWDFGDGSTSSLQNPSHTYAIPGYYEVALTVTTPSCTNCFRKVIFISPSCCAVDGTVSYDDATVVPDVISSDVTWSQPYKLNRTIFVEAGVTLTIAASNVIEFGPEGRIILDRRDPATTTGTGAKMIMELLSELTSITNSEPGCPVMWQGVEVWGNSNVNHNSNANRNAHGFLDMKEQSKIRNAHNGVILGKTLMPFGNSCDPPSADPAYPPYDLAFCGGILDAIESNSFIGNGVGVRMLPFRYNNFSLIRSCDFEGGVLLDQFYDSGSSHPYSGSNFPNRTPWYGEANQKGRSCIGIYMWSIKDLTLDRNDFHDIQAGIESYNAAFKTKYNTFDDHQYGIDVNNTVSSPNFVFRCFEFNIFKNISQSNGLSCSGIFLDNAGIRIRGGVSNKIQVQNKFGDLTNTEPQPNSSVGMQLLSCNGTRIIDNKFGDLYYGIFTSGSFITSGLIGFNSEGNLFQDVRNTGIFSISNNPAMRVKCNNWTSPNAICPTDHACWRNQGSLPSQQGNAGLNTIRPAGNEWNKDDANAFVNVSTTFPFIYRHHTPNNNYPSVVPFLQGGTLFQNGVFKDPTSCVPAPLIQEGSTSKLDSVNAVLDSLINIHVEILANIDGGKTTEILGYINDSTLSQDSLRAYLELYSPLSDNVLNEFLGSPMHFSDSIIFNVMKYNLPVSNTVYHTFKNRLGSLTNQQFIDSLGILHGDNPLSRTPFSVYREIESSTYDKNDIIDFIATEYAENDSVSDLITFLAEQSDKNYKMQAVAAALEVDSLQLARNILEVIDIETTAEVYWADILQMILSLKDSSKTVFSMDSTMIARVIEIASSGIECVGTRNAQCIMKLVYGIDFAEGEFATSRMMNNVHGSESQLSSSSKTNTGLVIQPNPADNSITIHFPFHNSKTSIKIFDISGKLITLVEINADQNSYVLNTTELKNGIYQLLFLNGKSYNASKFIIQH